LYAQKWNLVVQGESKVLIEFDATALQIGLAVLVIALALIGWRTRNWSQLFYCAIFGLYLLGVVKEAVFPIFIPEAGAVQSPFHLNLNLIPFYFGDCSIMPERCFWDAFNNILLTVPFGFGLSFVIRLKARNFTWLPLAAGLSLELSQLAFCLIFRGGFRAIDINDVLLNAAGGWLGYGLFRGFAWFYVALAHRFRIPLKGILAYTYEIANHAAVG
jgi:glycopeptide antibiotics resistance protein